MLTLRRARSITAVREQHQGMYRAVVQQGPFGGITHDVPAAILISEARPMRNQQSRVHFADAISPQPAFVFVLPAEAADATPPSCAICLSEVPPAERFRFRRKIEESYHSGFRNLSAAGTFSEELMYCRRVCARFLPAVAWHCIDAMACDAMRSDPF
jgi:hypothetical protein